MQAHQYVYGPFWFRFLIITQIIKIKSGNIDYTIKCFAASPMDSRCLGFQI